VSLATAADGTGKAMISLVVRRMTWEADDVMSVDLVGSAGGDLPEWTAGAHIDLVLTPELIRQYSLCGDPGDRAQWRVSVLKEPEGQGGSQFIHEVLRPGMTVAALGPRNTFPLVDAGRYLFIGGGVGVTPLLPMLSRVAASGAAWRLLYAGRRRSAMAYLADLATFAGHVQLAPKDEGVQLNLASELSTEPLTSEVYCCGPERMIAEVETLCEQFGRPAPHVERFAARPGFSQGGDLGANTEFELVLDNSGRRLTVPFDKTIIQVLDEAGIYVATSCTEGYCGVCETKVVSGIPDHRDDYLTAEERASNKTMMICVGRSKTPELRIKK
jgi:ferredoxin-NADP reductase